MAKAPEVWVLLEKGLLLLKGLSQAQLLLDVLLTPALDHHVALLQVVHQVPHHINNFVFSTSVNQIGLGQDPCKTDTGIRGYAPPQDSRKCSSH